MEKMIIKEPIAEESLASKVSRLLLPVLAGVMKHHRVEYAEVVTCIAAQNADDRMRSHIDEFILEVKGYLEHGGAGIGKAILLLNPAVPPVLMTNTIYLQLGGAANGGGWEADRVNSAVLVEVKQAVAEIQKDFPSFHLKAEPMIEGNKLTLLTEGGAAL